MKRYAGIVIDSKGQPVPGVLLTVNLAGTGSAAQIFSSRKSVYTLKAANSDLTGGADFTRELSEGTEVASSITVSVAASAAEDSYAFSKIGIPGAAGGDGVLDLYFTIEAKVTVANANLTLTIQVARVNSSGTVQTGPVTIGSAQGLGSTGVKTYTGSANLGAWTTGDRLRVTYRFINSAGTAQSVTIETGTSDTEHTAPWGVAKANPLLNDSSGFFDFWAKNNRLDIVPSKTGNTFSGSQWLDLLLFDPDEGIVIKRTTPFIRLIGTETSGKDCRLIEDTGVLKLQRNDGTEASPTWVTIFEWNLSTKALIPHGAVNCDADSAARLVVPVGTDQWAT